MTKTHHLRDAARVGAVRLVGTRRQEALRVALFNAHDRKAALRQGSIEPFRQGCIKAIYSKPIEYTDFPLPEIELYFTNSTILLPSEY
jgi:hypothetical protein